MIIPNGYIQFLEPSNGGKDANGYPTPAAEKWSDAVECQYLLREDRQSRVQGEAVSTESYTVYVDQMECQSEIVRLFTLSGKEIGRFSLRSVEQLDAVCQTRVTF